MLLDSAKKLADELKQSDEYKSFHALRTQIEENQGLKALLNEYHRAQFELQMEQLSGNEVNQEKLKRFSDIASLLNSSEEANDFLLAELRLRNLVGEIIKIITDAGGMPLDIPEI